MNTLCPCGSTQSYEACCAKYIENLEAAPTPEALMRSRYSAYTKGNIAYIKQTMKGAPLSDFNEDDTALWLKDVNWTGLKVIQTRIKSDKLGFVSFEARYLQQGEPQAICEKSEFHKIDNKWFYVGGKPLNPNKEW